MGHGVVGASGSEAQHVRGMLWESCGASRLCTAGASRFLRFAANVLPRGTFVDHGQQAVGSNPPSEHLPVTLWCDVPPACCNPAAFSLMPHFQASVAQIETLRTIRTCLINILYKCFVAVRFTHSCQRACNTLSPQHPLPVYPTIEKLKHARYKGLAMATRVPSCAQLQRRAATQQCCFVGCRVVCSVRHGCKNPMSSEAVPLSAAL